MQLCSSLNILWYCLSLGLEWKLNFSNLVATAEFSRFSEIFECSSFTASSFRIWNSSTRISLPPLAFFIVMLPKVHLASDFKMSGSRWVIIPSWLSGSWRFFFYSSSGYSCQLFLVSSAPVRTYHFCPLLVHLCMKSSLGISNFLEEISSLSHPIVFLHVIILTWLLIVHCVHSLRTGGL